MIRSILRRVCTRENMLLYTRQKSTTSAAAEEFDLDETGFVEDEDDKKLTEEDIMKKRNKSRLSQAHFNILHNRVPYSEPMIDAHKTIKYNRKMFGKFGEASGVDPRLCWLTMEEIEDRKDYERVAYPYTIQQVMKENERKNREFEEQRRKRQEDIVKKFAKLEQWKKDLRERIAKREAEALAVKERKDRLVEEVRRHFGFKIDPKDERFKQMLEQKEKADKKAEKEERRKLKEQKLMAKLQEKEVATETKPVTNES